MKRAVLALLLLATCGLSLAAGPHPCQAAHGQPMSRHSSCHGAGAPTGPSGDASVLSQGVRSCCKTACEHACHMVMAVAVPPVTFTAALASQGLAETAGRDCPPFAQAIDHIPLP